MNNPISNVTAFKIRFLPITRARGFLLLLGIVSLSFVLSSGVLADIKQGISNDIPAQISDTKDNAGEKPLVNIEVQRGQLLYENHCRKCHESNVHIRAQRKAKSQTDIRSWVVKWSSYLDLKWSSGEVSDVVEFLNTTFYGFEANK